MSRRVTLLCDSIEGYFDINFSEEDYNEFVNLSHEEQVNWIKKHGNLIITSIKVKNFDNN